MSNPELPTGQPVIDGTIDDLATAMRDHLAQQYPDAQPTAPADDAIPVPFTFPDDATAGASTAESAPRADSVEGGEGSGATPPQPPSSEPPELDPAALTPDMSEVMRAAQTGAVDDDGVIATQDPPAGDGGAPASAGSSAPPTSPHNLGADPIGPPANDDLPFDQRTVDVNEVFEHWTGNKPTVAAVTQTFDFVARAAALPEREQQLLNALVSGATVDQIAAALAPPPQPPTTPTQQRPTQQPPAGYVDDLDPDYSNQQSQLVLPPHIQAKIDQVDALTEHIARQEAAQREQQFAIINEGINRGRNEFVSSHPELSTTEIMDLERELNNTGLFGSLVQRGQSPDQAFQVAMENMLMVNPELRARAIQTAAAQAQPTTEEVARQTKANALSGGAGSMNTPLPTPTPPPALDPSQPLTSQTMRKQFVEALNQMGIKD